MICFRLKGQSCDLGRVQAQAPQTFGGGAEQAFEFLGVRGTAGQGALETHVLALRGQKNWTVDDGEQLPSGYFRSHVVNRQLLDATVNVSSNDTMPGVV